jgi:transposase
MDPALLSPVRHRSEAAQVDLAHARARDTLLRCRTALISHVRGAVKALGGRIPSCDARAFARRAPEHIPESLRPALMPLVDQVASVSVQMKELERRIERAADERYPETRLLRQVNGVGPITALVYVLTIEDPERFAKSRTVPAYLGLTPRRRDSGDSHPQLRISKAGDPMLRRLMVNCANYILGPFGQDCDLRRWGLKLMERGGRAARKRAVVALARKLAVLLHHLWRTGEVYEPDRHAAIEAAAA